ncbi:hypothetical protein [Fusobacterium ulcerans]|nr:hypothetical protein [Fusobacterium ulcerans]
MIGCSNQNSRPSAENMDQNRQRLLNLAMEKNKLKEQEKLREQEK